MLLNPTNKKVIVYDLDGTICKIPDEYFIYINVTPKNWSAFHCHIPYDTPYPQTKFLFELIGDHTNCIQILATARVEKYRADTENWMKKEGLTAYEKLYMRDNFDWRPDYEAKQDMLKQIEKEYGKPFLVFDDRNAVLNMYQNNGIFTLGINQGKGEV